MQTESVPNTKTANKINSLARPSNKKLDTTVMTMMLSAVINQLQSTDLYQEDQGVLADYEQLQYAIDSMHQYLYDQKHSNLTHQDAQIFSAYLVEKTKSLKTLVDRIGKK